MLAGLEAGEGEGPKNIDPAELPALLGDLMNEIAVRPPQGGHPRLAILGLIEARMQSADLVVLGGLNDGTWPTLPAPDPWLAPRIRAEVLVIVTLTGSVVGVAGTAAVAATIAALGTWAVAR